MLGDGALRVEAMGGCKAMQGLVSSSNEAKNPFGILCRRKGFAESFKNM
jgi:hypothetical protein